MNIPHILTLTHAVGRKSCTFIVSCIIPCRDMKPDNILLDDHGKSVVHEQCIDRSTGIVGYSIGYILFVLGMCVLYNLI